MADGNQLSTMLKLADVAHILHVHINTVRRWSNQGILRAYRIGPRGDRRYSQRDISQLLAVLGNNRGDIRKATFTLNQGSRASKGLNSN